MLGIQAQYKLAKVLVKIGFAGMVDKAGRPMVEHMSRVEDHLSKIFVDGIVSYELRTVALLHDIVEDTEMTIEEVSEYFPHIWSPIDALSKRKGETYFEYIDRCIKTSYYDMALYVKIADTWDHLEQAFVGGDQVIPDSMIKRYKIAMNILLHNIDLDLIRKDHTLYAMKATMIKEALESE